MIQQFGTVARHHHFIKGEEERDRSQINISVELTVHQVIVKLCFSELLPNFFLDTPNPISRIR